MDAHCNKALGIAEYSYITLLHMILLHKIRYVLNTSSHLEWITLDSLLVLLLSRGIRREQLIVIIAQQRIMWRSQLYATLSV